MKNMKILLISYSDYDYDGRLRELLKVFSSIGDTYCITKGDNKHFDKQYVCHNDSYLMFILKSLITKSRLKNIDIIVLDNRKATIPGLLINLGNKYYTIQDCRELYDIESVRSLVSKIGCIFEKICISKSNIVICANEERAEIMKKKYNLSKRPIVFENLRKLEYSSNAYGEKKLHELDKYFISGEVRIISSSGCSISRTNDILVKNICKVNKNVRLFLVGDNNTDDYNKIDELIKKNDMRNVEILGKLNQSELKYLIQNSHIGIVNYGQEDLNNKYCASGKIYEFLYEGIPVVTTTNPPLKKMCEKYNVGIADDEYYSGINKVINDYDYYKKNVENFIKNHTIEENNRNLKNRITKALEGRFNTL